MPVRASVSIETKWPGVSAALVHSIRYRAGEKVRFTQQFSLEHIGELVLVPAAPVHLDPQRASERFEFKLRGLEAECLGTCAHIIDSVFASVGAPVRALVSIDSQLVHSSQ